MRIRERLWIGFLTVVLALTAVGSAFAQQTSPPEMVRKFKLGTDIGFSGGTIDGTALAIGISGDYEVAPHVSVGPLMQFGVTDNLFQIGVSAQVKLTLDLPDVPQLKPQLQAGIGFIHADLDFGPFSADDTSWLIPIGMGLEYRAAKNLYFDSTLLFNVTDLNIANKSDDLHVTWFVGLRFLL
jgi:Outer membrane protein beta-barrel domain